MSFFRTSTGRPLDIGLALLRTAVGAVFIAHGAQKLFVYGFAGVSGGFAQMGIPFPGLLGPAIGLLEFFGGLALVAGLLTRFVSLGLAFNMLGAWLLVHLSAGFFLPSGYEFVMTLFAASGALTLIGAGRYSADALFARRGDGGSSAATPREVSARRAA